MFIIYFSIFKIIYNNSLIKMRASGNNKDEAENMQQLLENTIKKFELITNYYKEKKILDNEFRNHSVIILLVLREMESLKNIFSEKSVKLFQFNLELQKSYKMRFKKIELNSKFIEDKKAELDRLIDDLKKYGYSNKIKKEYETSIIDNIITPLEKKEFPKIIKTSWDSNFHQFFLDFISIEIISKKAYTKEYLNKLYLIRYITEILIFIKYWIQYTNNLIGGKNYNIPVSQEEIDICKKNAFDEERILTLSLFQEIESTKYENIKDNLDMIKDNKKALNELILLYKQILKIIKDFGKKIE